MSSTQTETSRMICETRPSRLTSTLRLIGHILAQDPDTKTFEGAAGMS
jgi:hypothetical protein